MIVIDEQLAVRFNYSLLGLSVRRTWEHIYLRQITPFEPITPTSSLKPQNYVDIITVCGPVITITGLTLADLLTGKHQGLRLTHVNQLLRNVKKARVQRWLYKVQEILLQFSKQRSVRNIPAPFLPKDNTDPLGVQGLQCALLTWLNAHRSEKADAKHWIQRIRNLNKRGLSAEELKFSGIEEGLDEQIGKSISGATVIKRSDYSNLQLSILPMVHKAGSHLTFLKVPSETTVKRIKPKLKSGLQSSPQWRDPVLGYWIDVIDWNDLLGHQRGWMALTHRGQPITSHDQPLGLCDTEEIAWDLADDHAKQLIPKMTARGLWSHLRLTGGEQYREWLVTLPHYGSSYISDHFDHHNILLHVRCDIREDANSERVLVLQEVQSDWAQNARRALKVGSDLSRIIPTLPWLKDWPALALKLMLLHAAHLNVAGLAWTPGSIQVKRWKGLGKKGLINLYDRTLPTELTRILRPYKKQCESIDVYLPVNFYVDPTDTGYIVMDEDGNDLGTAATSTEAQNLFPDGAHEKLTTMHGIKLDAPLRQNIISNGFYAWGGGIH